MLLLSLNEAERQALLTCIESAVKHAPNSLQAAAQMLPLAVKIDSAKDTSPPTPEVAG